MLIKKKIRLNGSEDKIILADLHIPEKKKDMPLAIFIHGFKGFKDWGHWSLIAKEFALKGIAFLKFNFSHNGTTEDAPEEFGDLEAFGQNNFSKELFDLNVVIDYLNSKQFQRENELSLQNTFLIGHSRGGPVALIQAHQDMRVHGAITWASVHTLEYAWNNSGMVEAWRKDQVYHVINGRTKQQMPLYFQLYEDYVAHRAEYSTKEILKEFAKPLKIIHGDSDPAIHLKAAEVLHSWSTHSELDIVEGGDHVFNGYHPYIQDRLPTQSVHLVNSSCDFIKKHSKNK